MDLPNDCERLVVDVPVPGLKDAKGKPLTQRLVLRRTQAALLLQHDYNAQARECLRDQREGYQNYQ